MSRWLATLGAGLLACGGGDSNDPGDLFPDAAGVYQMSGGFDDIPSTIASFEGTLALTQATRESGELGGSAAITAEINGDVFNVSDPVLGAASVSPNGTVTFTMADLSGTWTFTGEFSGSSITNGRHTLSGTGSESFSGDWSASKTGNLKAQPQAPPRGAARTLAAFAAGLRARQTLEGAVR